jgi:RNA polymerase sigma-70 factor (ECF subfamily)
MGLTLHTETQNHSSYDELDLLRQARRFDEDALTCIYQTYYTAIYRYIYHHLGDMQTAQDLASEVFRRFLQALRNGDGPTQQLSAWLYRVGHNLIVDELRSRAHRNHQPLDDVLGETLKDGGQSPEEMVGNAIAGTRVREALYHLTPEQRQVIVLKFLEGMDNAEVSRITGKTVSAVKALQHRALCTLRDQLDAEREAKTATAVLEQAAALF